MVKSEISTFDQFTATIWNRENEMEYIRNAMQDPPQEHGSIYYFHGISGVGKSKLCDYTRRYVQNQFQAPYAMVNIDMSSELTEAQMIQKLYRALVSHVELPFPRYEAASSYLFSVTGDPIYKIELPDDAPPLIHSVFDYATKLGICALDISIPTTDHLLFNIAAELATCTAEWFLSSIGSALSEHLKKRVITDKQRELTQFFHDLSLQSPNEIRHNLGLYFMNDLKQSLESIRNVAEDQNYHLIVTIDAFEKRQHDISFDRFLKQLFECTGETTWFLFGTEASIFQQDHTHTMTLHSYPVSPFDTDNLKEYLEGQGIYSEEDQNIIINASQGLPAAIQIMIDIYRHNGGYLDKAVELQGYNDLFDQYFSHHLTKQEQKIFFRLASFDYWDQDVFSYIYPSFDSSHEVFEEITNKTALVVKSSFSGSEGDKYCLIDIVRKALLARREADESGALMDSYRIKYEYERAVSNRYLEQLRQSVLVGQELNEKLRSHCMAAFHAGLKSYSNKEEFEDVSQWCTKAQQAMSKRGLYQLKADLTKLYLELVEERDSFVYDTESDIEKRYRFRNMRDRIWAFRYSSSGREATSLAGQYYAELLTKFGIDCPHIPFATYLWGLTFYDIGEYKTAQWLLEQSMEFESSAYQDTKELNSSISTVVHNALGCLKMDLDRFKEAEIDFLEAQRTRAESDVNGKKNTCSNLSRLYFRWAQYTARKKPDSKKISQRLDLSKKYVDEYETLLSRSEVRSIADQYTITSRRIMLAIAQERLSGKIKTSVSAWKDYFDCLEKAVDELNHNAAATIKSTLPIHHNLAVMYALQMRLDEAQHELSTCVNIAERIYSDGIFKVTVNSPSV